MAKITITIEDNEDGVVDVAMEFDPPAPQEGEDETPAQSAAGYAMQALMDNAIGELPFDEEEEDYV